MFFGFLDLSQYFSNLHGLALPGIIKLWAQNDGGVLSKRLEFKKRQAQQIKLHPSGKLLEAIGPIGKLPLELIHIIIAHLENAEDVKAFLSVHQRFWGNQTQLEKTFLKAQYPETWILVKSHWENIKIDDKLSPVDFHRCWLNYISMEKHAINPAYGALLVVFPKRYTPQFIYQRKSLPQRSWANVCLLIMAAQVGNITLCLEMLDKEALFGHWRSLIGNASRLGNPMLIVSLLRWRKRNIDWLQYQPSYQEDQKYLEKDLLDIALWHDYPSVAKVLMEDWMVMTRNAFTISHMFIRARQSEGDNIWSQYFEKCCQWLTPTERESIVQKIAEGKNAAGVFFTDRSERVNLPYLALLDTLGRDPEFQSAVSAYGASIFNTEAYNSTAAYNSTEAYKQSQELLLQESIVAGNWNMVTSSIQSTAISLEELMSRMHAIQCNKNYKYREFHPSQLHYQSVEHSKIIRYLLEGTPTLIKEMIVKSQGKAFFNLAAEIGCTAVLDYLIQSPKITENFDYDTAIQLAAKNGHLATIQFLRPLVSEETLVEVMTLAIQSGYSYIVLDLLNGTIGKTRFSLERVLEHILYQSTKHGALATFQSVWIQYKNKVKGSLDGESLFAVSIGPIKRLGMGEKEHLLFLHSIAEGRLAIGQYLLEEEILLPSESTLERLYLYAKENIFAEPYREETLLDQYAQFALTMIEKLLEASFDITPYFNSFIKILGEKTSLAALHQLFIANAYPLLQAKIGNQVELKILQNKLPLIFAVQSLPLIQRFISLKSLMETLSNQDLEGMQQYFAKDKAGTSAHLWFKQQRKDLSSGVSAKIDSLAFN